MRCIKLFLLGTFLMISLGTFAQDNIKTVKLEQVPGKFTTKKVKLKPGTYVFEVTNRSVDHEVGFVLAPKKTAITTEDHIKEAYLSQIINEGQTGTSSEVTLTSGEYVYFCPLNPTPQYTLVVE